jgi:hypothetical protein
MGRDARRLRGYEFCFTIACGERGVTCRPANAGAESPAGWLDTAGRSIIIVDPFHSLYTPEKNMLRYLTPALFVLFSLPCVAADDPLAAPPEPEGMQSLFNGQDLKGWDGDPRLWSVVDSVIRGETTAENAAKGNTFLIWQDGVLKDFELRLTFRCNATNNSGIQYRSTHITEGNPRNAWVVRGYQHEIRNQEQLPSVSGFIYEEGGKRGRMCLVGEKAVWGEDGKKEVLDTLIDAEGYQELFKLDDWNDVIIIGQGSRIRHYMNGRLILDCTDNHPELARKEGVLALQLHAGNPMWVEYKNVRLKQ